MTALAFSPTDVRRFYASIRPGEHWHWSGTVSPTGYGRFSVGGRFIAAHRASLLLAGVPVPDDLTVDHLCRVRDCVRPEHLEVVTLRENVLRGTGLSAANARKTHCPRGHEFTAENTVYIASRNYRRCRVCWNEYRRRRYHANREG